MLAKVALGAFESKGELEKNLETYKENRKKLLNALPEIGLVNLRRLMVHFIYT